MADVLQFFQFLNSNPNVAWIVLGLLIFLMVACQWSMWLGGFGRFKQSAFGEQRIVTQNLRYLVTEALTKIINDFRHLLALIIVIIFALALTYALCRAGSDIAQIKEALQAVTATLGGLVGSIIGYYFGESKGLAMRQPDRELDVVPDVPDPGAGIVKAAARPGENSSTDGSTEGVEK